MKTYMLLFSALFFINIESMNAPLDNLINAINRLDVERCRNILSNISLSKSDKKLCFQALRNTPGSSKNYDNYNLLYNLSKFPLQISAIITAGGSLFLLMAYLAPKEKNRKKRKIFLDNGNINTYELAKFLCRGSFYLPCSITAIFGTITAILCLLRNHERNCIDSTAQIRSLLQN